MRNIVFIQAHVDFTSDLTLKLLAPRVANVCFGGGEFVSEGTGIWDEVPAVRLKHEPLGLRVVLGGAPDVGFTLEVESAEALGGKLAVGPECVDSIADLSTYLSGLLARIPEVKIALAF